MKKKILLFSICGLILFTGCVGTKKEVTDVKDIEVKINKEDNLSLDYVLTDNDAIIMTIKNTGSEMIDYVNIDVALFDEKNNLMRVEKNYIRNIGADSENIAKVQLTQIDTNGDNSALPYRVEIALNKTIYSTKYETSYADKVTGSIEETDAEGQLNLVLTNESGVVIDDLSAVAVFYKNSKIVDIYNISVQQVGITTNQTIYIPTSLKDGKVSYIDYDDIEFMNLSIQSE